MLNGASVRSALGKKGVAKKWKLSAQFCVSWNLLYVANKHNFKQFSNSCSFKRKISFKRHKTVPTIDQFRYIEIQLRTIDLSTRLWGINTEFVGFIPRSLVLRSFLLGWILVYRNWSIYTSLPLLPFLILNILTFYLQCRKNMLRVKNTYFTGYRNYLDMIFIPPNTLGPPHLLCQCQSRFHQF